GRAPAAGRPRPPLSWWPRQSPARTPWQAPASRWTVPRSGRGQRWRAAHRDKPAPDRTGRAEGAVPGRWPASSVSPGAGGAPKVCDQQIGGIQGILYGIGSVLTAREKPAQRMRRKLLAQPVVADHARRLGAGNHIAGLDELQFV